MIISAWSMINSLPKSTKQCKALHFLACVPIKKNTSIVSDLEQVPDRPSWNLEFPFAWKIPNNIKIMEPDQKSAYPSIQSAAAVANSKAEHKTGAHGDYI